MSRSTRQWLRQLQGVAPGVQYVRLVRTGVLHQHIRHAVTQKPQHVSLDEVHQLMGHIPRQVVQLLLRQSIEIISTSVCWMLVKAVNQRQR